MAGLAQLRCCRVVAAEHQSGLSETLTQYSIFNQALSKCTQKQHQYCWEQPRSAQYLHSHIIWSKPLLAGHRLLAFYYCPVQKISGFSSTCYRAIKHRHVKNSSTFLVETYQEYIARDIVIIKLNQCSQRESMIQLSNICIELDFQVITSCS